MMSLWGVVRTGGFAGVVMAFPAVVYEMGAVHVVKKAGWQVTLYWAQ